MQLHGLLTTSIKKFIVIVMHLLINLFTYMFALSPVADLVITQSSLFTSELLEGESPQTHKSPIILALQVILYLL